MSYKSRHGITRIKKTKLDNLVISRDYDTNPNREYPVLTFTPYVEEESDHYHIELSLKEARELHKWLGEYIDERAVKAKGKIKKQSSKKKSSRR